LIGCQANPLMFVHEVKHFSNQPPQFGIDLFNWLGSMPKDGVRVMDDLK